MLEVSDKFKQAALDNIKQTSMYITYMDDDGVIQTMRDTDDLVDVKITSETSLASTAIKFITLTFKKELLLVDKEVTVYHGFVIDTGAVEYINLGTFIIESQETQKDKVKRIAKGNDYMLKFHQEYVMTGVEFPVTVKQFAQSICNWVGVELETKSFTNDSFMVDEDLYFDTQTTYREAIEDICEVTNTIAYIRNNKLFFKDYTSSVTLTDSHLLEYSIVAPFGPVNSLVLARTPQEDNVYSRDESIADEDVIEVKVENNYIVERKREDVVDSLFPIYEGIAFYPFNIKTVGIAFLELGDYVQIDVEGESLKSLICGIDWSFSTGFKEVLYCKEPLKTTTKYQYATNSQRRLKRTEIIVDKQAGEIISVVEATQGFTSEISELRQTIEGLSYTVTNTGGSNLIKNSVGFNNTEFWDVPEDTIMETLQNTDIRYSTVSGSAFNLRRGTFSQRINVLKNKEYTLTFVYRKTAFNNITFSMNNEIVLSDSENATSFKKFTITRIMYDTELHIEFMSDNDNLLISDLILTQGNTEVIWQQASGEIYGVGFAIDTKGIKITSAESGIITQINNEAYVIKNDRSSSVIAQFTKDGLETQAAYVRDELDVGKLRVIPNNNGVIFHVKD